MSGQNDVVKFVVDEVLKRIPLPRLPEKRGGGKSGGR